MPVAICSMRDSSCREAKAFCVRLQLRSAYNHEGNVREERDGQGGNGKSDDEIF